MAKKDFTSLSFNDGILGAWDYRYKEVELIIEEDINVVNDHLLDGNEQLSSFFSTPIEQIEKQESLRILPKVKKFKPLINPIFTYLNDNYSFWDKVKYFFYNFKFYNG